MKKREEMSTHLRKFLVRRAPGPLCLAHSNNRLHRVSGSAPPHFRCRRIQHCSHPWGWTGSSHCSTDPAGMAEGQRCRSDSMYLKNTQADENNGDKMNQKDKSVCQHLFLSLFQLFVDAGYTDDKCFKKMYLSSTANITDNAKHFSLCVYSKKDF